MVKNHFMKGQKTMLYGADDWGDDDDKPNENNKSNIICITSSIFFGLSSIIIYKIL